MTYKYVWHVWWLRNHERPGPCLPLLFCFKASSAWQLAKAQSQNIINYRLNPTWAGIKHVHQLFKSGWFKSSLRCLAGLGPATCVPAAGVSQCAAKAHLGFLQNRTLSWVQHYPSCKSRSLSCQPRGCCQQEVMGLSSWISPSSTSFTLRTPNHCNTERNGHDVLLKNLSEGKVAFVMAFSPLSPGDFAFC